MDKKEALLVWEHEFGSLEYAYDITGRKIKRDDYMVTNQVGWVVAYMRPLSLGGKMDDGNTIILHHHTAYEKGENYPIFTVDCVETADFININFWFFTHNDEIQSINNYVLIDDIAVSRVNVVNK